MITKITHQEEIDETLFCMPWSVYPYSNFKKYGLDNPIFSIYRVNTVIFTVHDGTIQICSISLKESEYDEIISFIADNNIRMVSGPNSSLSFLFSKIKKGVFENGCIFKVKSFSYSNNYMIKKANSKKEFEEIVSVVCQANSNNTSYYTNSQLFNQFFDRYKEGYSRNWISLDKNYKIIGHISTYAEASNFCVLGGLAVVPNYRGQGVAKALLSFALNEMKQENKDCYVFCYNKSIEDFYRKISIEEYPCSKILLK